MIDVENALGEYLAGMDDCPPIAWPNKDYSGAVPYIEFRHAPNGRTDVTIDGGFVSSQGIVLLTVVVERDKFTNEANTLAWDIIARFPRGLRLDLDDGQVLIYQPTDLAPGFVDGVYWRQPVRVFYQTTP
jgi:hypothetical protein